jgi:hypothetical protein
MEINIQHIQHMVDNYLYSIIIIIYIYSYKVKFNLIKENKLTNENIDFNIISQKFFFLN